MSAALAAQDLLEAEGLQPGDIDVLLPSRVTDGFPARLGDALCLHRAHVVDLDALDCDPYSSTLVYGLREAEARGLAHPGAIGLFVHVGSGLQVGCAIYYF